MKKKALTLLEIMIVICLITLITGTIGYSMKGTLDKGRAFRTEQAKEQLSDLLLLCLADGGDADMIAQKPVNYLKKLGLAKDPEHLILDGWKEPFEITVNSSKNRFIIKSSAWTNYQNRMNKKISETIESEEEE